LTPAELPALACPGLLVAFRKQQQKQQQHGGSVCGLQQDIWTIMRHQSLSNLHIVALYSNNMLLSA
jgi:hypothetical protein